MSHAINILFNPESCTDNLERLNIIGRLEYFYAILRHCFFPEMYLWNTVIYIPKLSALRERRFHRICFVAGHLR
jgi:hypothetical protein